MTTKRTGFTLTELLIIIALLVILIAVVGVFAGGKEAKKQVAEQNCAAIVTALKQFAQDKFNSKLAIDIANKTCPPNSNAPAGFVGSNTDWANLYPTSSFQNFVTSPQYFQKALSPSFIFDFVALDGASNESQSFDESSMYRVKETTTGAHVDFSPQLMIVTP